MNTRLKDLLFLVLFLLLGWSCWVWSRKPMPIQPDTNVEGERIQKLRQ